MPAHKNVDQGSSSALRRRLLLSTALTAVVLAAASHSAGAANQVVTNTNDSGAGSLRQAILNSSAGDTITTTVSGTITLLSNLPAVAGQTIDLSGGNLVIAGPFGLPFNPGNSSLTSPALNTYTGATPLSTPGANLAVIGTAGYSAPQSQLQVNAATTFAANTTPTAGVAPGATFASLTGAGTVNLGPGGTGNGLDLTGNDQLSTTFAGNITGSGEFALFGGGGTLTLTGTNNTYSGPTDIFGNVIVGTPGGGPQGATLKAGATNAFSPNSAVVMQGGTLATLDLNNFNQTVASLAGSGMVKLGSAQLTFGDGTSTNFSGDVTGTGGLDKVGAGTFTLGFPGGATYSGGTLIDGGVFQAGAANVFSPNSPVAIAAGAKLDLNGFNQTIAALAGAGQVTLGSGTLTDDTGFSVTYSGVISGTGGLTKAGTGTLTLSGANTYSGTTTINGGAIQAAAANTFSPNSLLSVGANGKLDLNGFNETIAGLSGQGSVTLEGTTAAGTLTVNTAAGVSTAFGGVISGMGGIIAGSGGLTKAGAGTLSLSGSNTYNGTTSVNGGVLQAGANNAFSPSSQVAIAAGATLDLNGFDNTIAGLAGSGSVTLGSTPGSNGLTINPTIPFAFSGVISGGNGLTIGGGSTQILAGVNTYTGGTLINSGATLQLLGNGSIASSAAVFLNGSGKFDVSQIAAPITAVQAIFSQNSTPAPIVNVGGKTLIFGGSTPVGFGIPDVYLGSFTGNGGLVYAGTDTALLGGNNSGFTGTLLITAGTVSIGGDFTLNGVNSSFAGAPFGGNVTINPGGTLSGMGAIKGNVTNLSMVRPGGSIGTLTVNGNYTQGPNGTLAIEISPTASSKLVVGGAANLAGTLQLIYDPGIYTAGTAYNFLTASSINGNFSSIVSNNPSIDQALDVGPTRISARLTRVAPTNDTVFLNVTSQLVLNGQRANAIILDRVGNRAAGVADGQVALAGVGAQSLQLAQAGTGAMLGDFASTLPQALATQGAWFRGLGDFASVDNRGGVPGFTGSAGGFLAGYDRPVAPNIYLGLAGGYLHSNTDERGSGSTGSVDTARFAVYGGVFAGPSLFTGTVGYAHDSIDTSRPFGVFGTASGHHTGHEATVAGQWSLPLQVEGFGGGAATVTPKTGLQYLHLSELSFTESGAGGLNLASPSRYNDSFQPFVAVSASQKFVTAGGMFITPEVRLGYNREALGGARSLTVATITGVQFPVVGVRPSKNILTAGTGVTMDYAPDLAFYATYDGILPTGNTTDHTVQAGLRIKF
jgi:outer membrane autotransporter protein